MPKIWYCPVSTTRAAVHSSIQEADTISWTQFAGSLLTSWQDYEVSNDTDITERSSIALQTTQYVPVIITQGYANFSARGLHRTSHSL